MSRTIKRFCSVLVLMLILLGTVVSAQAGSIKQPDASLNVPFQVKNMFPGDSVTQDYVITVRHRNPITVYYAAVVRDPDAADVILDDVLKCRVEILDYNVTLYDGLMAKMPQSLAHELPAGDNELQYRITAYLDTSVGNPYMSQTLVADFYWWYLEEPEPSPSIEPSGTPAPSQPGEPSMPTPPPAQPGSPVTGDDTPIVLFAGLFVGAFVLLLILVFAGKRKKEDENGEK